jgi:putative tricarboxylic transport membrane protein
LILATLVMMESWRLKLDDIHNPGPGFMPFFLGLALAVLSILSILSPDRRPKSSAVWGDWEKGQNIFYIFAGLVVYVLLLKKLGFYLDTFWLMVFLFRFSGEKSYKRIFLLSLTTVCVIYIIFHRLLFIPFPQGLLKI